MLRTKYRLLVLVAVFIAFYVCLPIPYAPINRIAVELNINPQDPLLFETQHTAIFQYNNGTMEMTMTLSVTEVNQGANWANVSIVSDSTYWIQPSIDGLINNRYTIFWLHVPNVQLRGVSFGIEQGTTFNVTDPIGLIGPPNANYTAVVDRKIVNWALEPGLHGAQFSFIVTFYNESNNAVMGEALYDSTCGMLFSLEGGTPFIKIKLLETTYPISRNRMTVIPWAIGVFTGLAVVAYILMKKYWKLEPETIREVTLLLVAGGAAFTVDVYVDVWFYAMLGFAGSLLLHLGITLLLGAICLFQKYNLKCITPAIFELLFVTSMVIFVGDNFVPHLTAFWGLITSWFIMVYMSKHSPPQEPPTKRGKFFAEFV
mgnify:CR=1 FL=1